MQVIKELFVYLCIHKDTSRGLDLINDQIINHIPEYSLLVLLSIFNTLWEI